MIERGFPAGHHRLRPECVGLRLQQGRNRERGGYSVCGESLADRLLDDSRARAVESAATVTKTSASRRPLLTGSNRRRAVSSLLQRLQSPGVYNKREGASPASHSYVTQTTIVCADDRAAPFGYTFTDDNLNPRD